MNPIEKLYLIEIGGQEIPLGMMQRKIKCDQHFFDFLFPSPFIGLLSDFYELLRNSRGSLSFPSSCKVETHRSQDCKRINSKMAVVSAILNLDYGLF